MLEPLFHLLKNLMKRINSLVIIQRKQQRPQLRKLRRKLLLFKQPQNKLMMMNSISMNLLKISQIEIEVRANMMASMCN